MDEQERTRRRNVASASTSSNNPSHSDFRTGLSSHLSRIPSTGSQAEESINSGLFVVNPVSLARFHSYIRGPPVYQYPVPWQPYNYNLVYRNFSQAVLQPHLSQTCFHRPNHGNQERQVQGVTRNAKKNSVSVFRGWKKISERKEKSGFVFSVMSYNVLAQDLLEQHPHLYRSHNRQFLEWNIRWNNLLAEIQALSPDILCLQEVQVSHLDNYFSVLEHLGYRGVYKQRTGIRSDGCAIYYKHQLMNLTEYTTVEFNQPNVSLLDRDNVAIIGKFSPRRHPTKEFVVTTTHLLYNPKRQDVRLAQTQLLLTEMERLAFHQQGHYLPVIMTGDLNATPGSAVYRFITKGKLRYESLESRSLQHTTSGPKTGKIFLPAWLRVTDQCQHADLVASRSNNQTLPRSEEVKLMELKHSGRESGENKYKNADTDDASLFSSGTLTHKFLLESVYKHWNDGGIEGTTYQDEWVSVDYIFFSSKRQSNLNELVLLERYRLPTVNELCPIKIPNVDSGSDHLCLVAKFELAA